MSRINTSDFETLPLIRFSSFETKSDNGLTYKLKMEVPADDTYLIKLNENVCLYQLFDEKGLEILSLETNETKKIHLLKSSIIYVVITAKQENVSIKVSIKLTENESVLPYDPINVEDKAKYESLMDSKENGKNVLKSAKINYVKRPGGLYINCNNPEKLTEIDLEKALSRVDISNKEVFFTFEHNNYADGAFYYGYQVLNTGKEDIYVTVKNLGLQLDGPGSWLGEKEWIDFYNTKFRLLNKNKWNESQIENFKLYFGFCDTYESLNYQPVTYRVPAGKHIYVMGGTTIDAYNNTNVFDTADKKVSGGCSNGAVLFKVTGGTAEGIFYAYKDYKKVQADNKTHQGYVISKVDGTDGYGSQYVGYDNCHGVVDNSAIWEFNDFTLNQMLPVTFDNYYQDELVTQSVPYSKLNSTKHTQNATMWTTHINPQHTHNAVGSDMTAYYTVDKDGNKICIDYDHYDGLGHLANIGNWMIDYIDNFTFVNYGKKDRKIVIRMNNVGSLAVMVRDENGKIIKNTPQYTVVVNKSTNEGKEYEAINDRFVYEVVIPAKKVVQLFVEYNLLANSYGNVTHEVELKDAE